MPVTLTLGGGAALRTNTSAIQFFYQIGWFYPTYQTFEVSSTSGPLTFAVATSTTDGTHWLSAAPIGGTTTQTVTVSVAPGSLGPGTYTGKITVSSISTINNTLEIPVTLVVSNSALLTAGPSPATFAYQNGGALPPAQSVSIGSTSAPLDFTVGASTADGKSWLAVSPLSGTTPKNLTVVVNPGTLSAGTYTGTISVKSAVASNSPVQIPVTMVISSDSQLTASVQSLNFNYQPGGASQIYSQPVGVYSTGEPVTVAVGVSTSSCGANWLRSYDTTITTPQVITIAFDPMQVPASGNCQGAVTLTPTSGGSSVVIPVSLIISATPLLNIKPLSLSFTAPFEGATTSAQQILLAMTDNSVVSYTAEPSTVTGGNWMKVTGGSGTTGTTPASVKVSADPTGLGVGNLYGEPGGGFVRPDDRSEHTRHLPGDGYRDRYRSAAGALVRAIHHGGRAGFAEHHDRVRSRRHAGVGRHHIGRRFRQLAFCYSEHGDHAGNDLGQGEWKRPSRGCLPWHGRIHGAGRDE